MVLAAADRGGRSALRAGTHALARISGWAVQAALPKAPPGTDVTVPTPAGPVSFRQVRIAGLPPVTLAYERHGTGEPVVLLHGLGLNRHAWDAVVPLLTGHEVITVDLPGFGQSPDWPAAVPRDLPTTTAVLGALFTALGVERPHVVGHSLGGLIALRLGQAGLARSVTALAPAGFWNSRERRNAFALMTAARRLACSMPPEAMARLSRTPFGRAALAGTFYADPAKCPPDAVINCLRALRDAVGFTATLQAGRAPDLFTGDVPDIPVTIAWGTADRILPARQASRAMAMLPKAKLRWLPGCGHVPMNDAPALVARTIRQAIRSSTSSRVAPAAS